MGVDLGNSEWSCEESLAELARLAETDGAEVVLTMTQRLDAPVPKTFIGKGKVEELCSYVRSLGADVVIFDDELSPSQQGVDFLHLKMKDTKIDLEQAVLIAEALGARFCGEGNDGD